MTSGGVFSADARAAIYEAGLGKCVGCGRTDVTCQHRRARGMGGTSEVAIGHPANGLPLCGSGTWGCHGWAEAHPVLAQLLGWRLDAGQSAGEPWWSLQWGWRRWTLVGGFGHLYVDHFDLDQLEQRLDSIAKLQTARPPVIRQVGR